MNILLIIAAFYGLNGSLFKIYRSARVYRIYIVFRKSIEKSQDVPKWKEPDLELNRITTDILAFTLIGTGFLLAVFAEISGFQINSILLVVVAILQIITVWAMALVFKYINVEGYTEIPDITAFALPVLIFWIFPFFISISLFGTETSWIRALSFSVFFLSFLVSVVWFRFINSIPGHMGATE